MRISIQWGVMRGLGGLLDCLDAQHHVVCPVCVPPGRGDCLCVFALCFPLNVEGYIMNTLFVVIVILLTSNSAQLHCVSLGRACAVLPPVSLWFRSWNSFPAPEEMLPTAVERACSSCCPRCWCAQRTNSDSHFLEFSARIAMRNSV